MLGDGRAHGEQAARDEGRGAGLAGERDCLVRQRDRRGCVTDDQVIGHGDGEVDGGVGEVAARPRETGGLFGQAGGVGERAGSDRDVLERAAQMVSSTRQSGLAWRALASAARRHSSSAPVTSARFDANTALTARASG